MRNSVPSTDPVQHILFTNDEHVNAPHLALPELQDGEVQSHGRDLSGYYHEKTYIYMDHITDPDYTLSDAREMHSSYSADPIRRTGLHYSHEVITVFFPSA